MLSLPFVSDLDGRTGVACRRARTAKADAARTHELPHTVRADELLERLDLVGAPDELERDRVTADVGDAGTGDLAERDEVGATIGHHADRDQGQLALHRLVGSELGDTQDVHELVHLLLDLLERVLAAVDAQRESGDVGTFGGPDGEALDVVAAAREQLRHPRQRPRLVLEPHRDRVCRHTITSSSGASITSTEAAPAGTIGKTFSSGSQRTSTTALRPAANAASSALQSSSSVSTANPAQPYASASCA